MKMNKMLAFGASLVLLSSCVSLPAIAEENSYQNEAVIIGTVENEEIYLISFEDITRYVSQEDIDKFSSSHEKLECGDIILFDNVNSWTKPTEYTSQLWTDGAIDESRPAIISKIGSVWDNPETKQFTITHIWEPAISGFIYGFVLEDDKGEEEFYQTDWFGYGYYQLPDCTIDLTSLKEGDTIFCITYKGEPIFITEKVSAVTVNGDADGNGALDILDIITVNKAILGKENFDTERIPYIDFNQNQIPDSDDALTMLKMLVGLA